MKTSKAIPSTIDMTLYFHAVINKCFTVTYVTGKVEVLNSKHLLNIRLNICSMKYIIHIFNIILNIYSIYLLKHKNGKLNKCWAKMYMG